MVGINCWISKLESIVMEGEVIVCITYGSQAHPLHKLDAVALLMSMDEMSDRLRIAHDVYVEEGYDVRSTKE